ncbi:MAG: nucleotidyltransferase domain-containing protein [Ignavibacteria bacterium]|jgi:predicted nucleotidyltransferase|nr:nucleotidyltransferase domain-containing protein [Ignavibacteria bacterium]
MNRNEIQSIIAEHKTELQNKFGIINIGLFGSYARNEENTESDIDIAVEMQNADLFVISALKSYLQDTLKKNVDIVRIRKNMNLLLKNRIQKDALFIR